MICRSCLPDWQRNGALPPLLPLPPRLAVSHRRRPDSSSGVLRPGSRTLCFWLSGAIPALIKCQAEQIPKSTSVRFPIPEHQFAARNVPKAVCNDTGELYLPVSVLGLEGTQGSLFATWQDMFRRGAVNLFRLGTFLLPFSTV